MLAWRLRSGGGEPPNKHLKEEEEDEDEEDDYDALWDSGDVGAFECYIAAEEDPDNAEVWSVYVCMCVHIYMCQCK